MTNTKSQPTPLLPSLQPLSKLLGEWNVTIKWSEETHRVVGGPQMIETEVKVSWLKESGFMHYQVGTSHWLIGGDESSKEFTALYSDERLVSRVYKMSLNAGVWKIWREAPAFYQRFEGRIQKDGRQINATWEKSVDDGKTWKPDFSMTFARFS